MHKTDRIKQHAAALDSFEDEDVRELSEWEDVTGIYEKIQVQGDHIILILSKRLRIRLPRAAFKSLRSLKTGKPVGIIRAGDKILLRKG